MTDEPPDMLGMLSQMQQQLMEAQETVASRLVEGRSGGGAVVVSVSGSLEFTKVTIDPAVVDPGDVEMLEDLVLAAVRDAVAQAQEVSREILGGLGSMGLGGGLEGLLGG